MIPLQLSALGNHLWQSTVFAGAAVLVALALRQNGARVRYWVWLAASVKFPVPFSVLLTIGSQMEWRTAQPVETPPSVSLAIGQISQPFA
jgi:bla regulator protein blaR1